MSDQITPFGAECQKLRRIHGMKLKDQSIATHTKLEIISRFETGVERPSIKYVNDFCRWLNLDFIQNSKLIKKIGTSNNVLIFPEIKNKEAIKFYRSVHKLTPREIRNAAKPRSEPHE